MAMSRRVISSIVASVSAFETDGAYLRYVAHPALLFEVAQAVSTRPTARFSSSFVSLIDVIQRGLGVVPLLQLRADYGSARGHDQRFQDFPQCGNETGEPFWHY